MVDKKGPDQPTQTQKGKEKVARAIGAVTAAGIGYWLGHELGDKPVELGEGSELVYYMGGKDSPPDLWLGQVDVEPGDHVRVTGPVVKVDLFNPTAAKERGLEQKPGGVFTRVIVKAGPEGFPFFFIGDMTRRFKKGETATVYSRVLGLDAWGRPTERLDLGQRGGAHLLTEANLSPPTPWEAYGLAVGMGLAVLRRGEKLVHPNPFNSATGWPRR